VEQQLAAGLGEGQIAEFVEDDEVQRGSGSRPCGLPAGAGLGLEPLTRSTTLKKRPRAPARMQARAMAMARWVLPVPVPPTSTTLRWWARKLPAGEVAHQRLVDRRAGEVEVVDVLGQRQLGDGHLVLDRARLLLGDLGGSRSPTMRSGSCWRLMPRR
jgi:hypothetical protein